jgi:hypothetical protein
MRIFVYTVGMRTRLTLWPGQKGTKKLLAEYGEQLVCVRYRYDLARRRRYKTVELIVEESVWLPEPEAIVGLRIAWEEQGLRSQVKAVGGVWNAERKVWELAVGQVIALGLEERIVAENGQAVVPKTTAKQQAGG